jgi:hypothetical protein
MRTRTVLAGVFAAALTVPGLLLGGSVASASGGARVFVPSAVVNADHTVTLPLHQGLSGGKAVWFIVTEASDSGHAQRWRSSVSQKLANAKGTTAVQKVSIAPDGTIIFPATVDFLPTRLITPGTLGFPPLAAAPGAMGNTGYSPLIQLPDGAVLNAPQLANDSGKADKVVSIDTTHHSVRYRLTDGFARGNPVVYISTEATAPGPAAIEDVTFAPALDAAPFAGGDGTNSARATLAAFTNGPTGATNPQRQGLNSALLGQGDPLNVLAWTPNQGRYSPLWDVHLSTWAPGQTPTRQTQVANIEDLAAAGKITGPSGPWGPTGFIVDCPIIAQL